MSVMQVAITLCQLAAVLAQRQQQQQQQQQPYYENEQGSVRKQQPVNDQRSSSPQDRYTTPVPIIRFDKEQSADGSYKTRYCDFEVR
jgi:predicted lipid-binding transport protein (Tim44 family)